MRRYPIQLRQRARKLRSLGKTYREISNAIHVSVPKNTLSDWCHDVTLPDEYQKRIQQLNILNLGKARAIGVASNAIKREKLFGQLTKKNHPISEKIKRNYVAKIALAMLCLGEASKYSTRSSGFYLGSSDPRIITLFLELLKSCFPFKIEKVRCTVQCRADQDTQALEIFWQKVTHISSKNFYKSRIDSRTIGKPTENKDYKGVLKVDYFDRSVQLELESLADLVYRQVLLNSQYSG